MAKSIRSKVKKKHRSYMRQTIGEKVRTKNIEAAAKRLADKKKGRGNTKTLSYIKGALGGAGEVDLGRAYYDAIVKHAREPDASEAMDAEDVQPAPVASVATLEEEAACQLSLATKQQTHTAKLLLGRRGNGKAARRRRPRRPLDQYGRGAAPSLAPRPRAPPMPI